MLWVMTRGCRCQSTIFGVKRIDSVLRHHTDDMLDLELHVCIGSIQVLEFQISVALVFDTGILV